MAASAPLGPAVSAPSPASLSVTTLASPIASLPADILRAIFALFPLARRIRVVSLVCRHWRRHVLLTESALEFRHESSTCRQLARIASPIGCVTTYDGVCALLSNLRTLVLSPCPRAAHRLPLTLRHLTLLEHMAIPKGESLPALLSLSFSGGYANCVVPLLGASLSSLTKLSVALPPMDSTLTPFLAGARLPTLCDLDFSVICPTQVPALAAFVRTHANQLTALSVGSLPPDMSAAANLVSELASMTYPRLLRLCTPQRVVCPTREHYVAFLRNCPLLASLEVALPRNGEVSACPITEIEFAGLVCQKAESLTPISATGGARVTLQRAECAIMHLDGPDVLSLLQNNV